jgi:hypothetical protein
MVQYTCPRCIFETDHKSKMKVHIERKNPCKCTKLDIEIKDYEKEILDRTFDMTKCVLCNTIFSDKTMYNDHKLECDKQILNKLKELEEENLMLKSQLAIKTSMPITNNIDNSTTNINFNINLYPYNDPNLPDADKLYREAIKKIFMSVPKLIELIHFNTDLPENHNICIKNFRSKIAKVYNGKEWKTMDEDKLIDELINTYEGDLENWAEDNPKRMQYIEKYREIKERDGKGKVYKDLKDEVKKLIYDKRDMIKIKN